jgi:hypothetical protein
VLGQGRFGEVRTLVSRMQQPHPRSGAVTIGHGVMAIQVGKISLTGGSAAVQRSRLTIGGSFEPSHGRASEGDREVLHAGHRLIKLGYLISHFGSVITLLRCLVARLTRMITIRIFLFAILSCPITLMTRLNVSLMRCTQRPSDADHDPGFGGGRFTQGVQRGLDRRNSL